MDFGVIVMELNSCHPENVLQVKRSLKIKNGQKKEPKVKIGKDNYRHKRKIKSVRFPKTPKQERPVC